MVIDKYFACLGLGPVLLQGTDWYVICSYILLLVKVAHVILAFQLSDLQFADQQTPIPLSEFKSLKHLLWQRKVNESKTKLLWVNVVLQYYISCLDNSDKNKLSLRTKKGRNIVSGNDYVWDVTKSCIISAFWKPKQLTSELLCRSTLGIQLEKWKWQQN